MEKTFSSDDELPELVVGQPTPNTDIEDEELDGRVPHNSPTAQIVSQKMSVSHNVLGQFDELLQQLLVTEGDDTLQGGGAASEMSEV